MTPVLQIFYGPKCKKSPIRGVVFSEEAFWTQKGTINEMKKVVCATLILLIILAMTMTTGVAYATATMGRILEIQSDGNLLCQSAEGPDFLVEVSADTEYLLDTPLAPDMIIAIEPPEDDPDLSTDNPPRLKADIIRNGYYDGTVVDTDEEGHRLLVDDYLLGPVWVTIPAEDALDAFAGEWVRFIPYGTEDEHFQAAAVADEIEILKTKEGTVTEPSQEAFLLTTDEGTFMLVPDENTSIPVDIYDGATVVVTYRDDPTPGDTPEIIPLAVYVYNG